MEPGLTGPNGRSSKAEAGQAVADVHRGGDAHPGRRSVATAGHPLRGNEREETHPGQEPSVESHRRAPGSQQPLWPAGVEDGAEEVAGVPEPDEEEGGGRQARGGWQQRQRPDARGGDGAGHHRQAHRRGGSGGPGDGGAPGAQGLIGQEGFL